MKVFKSDDHDRRLRFVCILIVATAPFSAAGVGPREGVVDELPHVLSHHTNRRTVDFFQGGWTEECAALLLLHGLPSSSRMFEPLFRRLSGRYHLVAPDYPGFGHSDWPDLKTFAYTFDHYAETMNHFTEALGLAHYTLYMQDYGGPCQRQR